MMAAFGTNARWRSERLGLTGPEFPAGTNTVGDVAQQEHPHDGEQQSAGEHDEAGVAEGELEANAQPGRSIHGPVASAPVSMR